MQKIDPKQFFSKGPVQVIGSDDEELSNLDSKSDGFFDRTWRNFKSGISQAKSGLDQSASGRGNPINLLEGGLKVGAGAVNAAFSPLTSALEPVVKPTVGKAIEYAADKISDNPTVQKFANSKAGEVTSRVAEDVNNLNTIASAVVPPKAAGKLATVAEDAASNIPGKLAEITKPVIDKAQVKATASLAKTYEDIFKATKPGMRALERSLDAGKKPAEFLAKNGYIVDVENGTINPRATIDKIWKATDDFEPVLDNILAEKSMQLGDAGKVSLDTVGEQIKKNISTTANKASGTLSDQVKHVDNLIGELKSQFGDAVDLPTLNAIKRGQWREASVFDANKPQWAKDINYNTGKVIKDVIEETVPEAEVKKFNSYLGDHYDAIKMLEKVSGNKIKGGRLGGYSARAIGAIAGSHAGVAGSIGGVVAADAIQKLIQNNYIATPLKRYILSKVPKDSSMYESAQNALLNLFGKRLDTVGSPELPGASFIPAGPRTQTETPLQVIDAQPVEQIDPKTGTKRTIYQSNK